MKNLKYSLLIAVISLMTFSCKKFLNVTPIDAQSGNNFWQTKNDVEGFANGLYGRLKAKIGGQPDFFRGGNDRVFMPAIEMRCNWIKIVSGSDDDGQASFGSFTPFANLVNNSMRTINNGTTFYDNRMKNITDWKAFYDIVQSANIMYGEIDNVPSGALSETDRKRYKAEAVFMRNLSYMFITKLFGDAVYYTNAYNDAPLPRTPQLQVLNACITDMMAVKDDLPIQYTDANLNGFRPTRGSAIALLMHLNMWAAAWETTDKTKFYNAVKALGAELSTYTSYKLLVIDETTTKSIFKGRSTENLFSVLQEFNYGEKFSLPSNYSYFFSHFPYRGIPSKSTSFFCYEKDYITKLFPPGIPDARRTSWFENYDSDNGNFQFKKFANVVPTGSNLYVTNDDSAVIFRLPDALLLAADALAELGEDEAARGYLNQVRAAASAPDITSSGETLKEDIFYERSRELIGEGHWFFDAVRTKRISDSKYAKSPISVANINLGAWTWPLATSARTNNTNIVLNNYWN